MLALALAGSLLALPVARAGNGQTYYWGSLPDKTEDGQTGTNNCGTQNSQSSQCQTLVVNSIDDFCLWGPPEPNSSIGDTEQIEVAWCTKQGYGTRTIPAGTIQGAHFVQTPDFIQITGVGNFGQMNINGGGGGGELDPHGADGNGNPHGALVFTNAFGGGMTQAHEWTNFMSDSEFCIRVCKDASNAWLYCNHIYDIMGCSWNMPGNYAGGSFDTCKADSGTPMGLYPSGGNAWGSTFHQGDAYTPAGHDAPASSQCQNVASPTGGSASSMTPASSTTPSSSKASSSTITSSSTSTSASTTKSVTTTIQSTSTSTSGTTTRVTTVTSSTTMTSTPTSSGTRASNVVTASSTTTSGANKLAVSAFGIIGVLAGLLALA